MLSIAFKEWAVICRALATGRQSLIIRKGGIAEEGGIFKPEHPRFWLYPTLFHEQQQKGVKPAAMPLLEEAERDRPEPGTLRFTHGVDVSAVHFVENLDAALALDEFHIWSPEVITQRFHYRSPGLYVLLVRAWKATPVEMPERPEFAGCKTWVELGRELPDDGTPVLGDEEHRQRVDAVRDRLTHTRG
ncbi:DUF1802 family protein [Limnoglobus roseus]|uniref:DUF1802 domain-containing protein n=1 Tax=Limnoglobus roseus TaxID=2598579 RepID=A0A5C1ALC1_9BACT|nr:DUF1802 family protein [Limnoglobus roseus]QEL18953.1 hypothetical protein PX52LOC_06003 [Limnoglobus roseus]